MILLVISIFFLLNISSVCGAIISEMPDDSGVSDGINELDENILTGSVDDVPTYCGDDDEMYELVPIDDLDKGDGDSADSSQGHVLEEASSSQEFYVDDGSSAVDYHGHVLGASSAVGHPVKVLGASSASDIPIGGTGEDKVHEIASFEDLKSVISKLKSGDV